MAFVHKEFDNMQELVDYLNGVIAGKGLPNLSFNLNGLTLIIDAGSGDKTVTFSGPELTPKQVLDQIRAADASLASVGTLRNYGHSSASGGSSAKLAFTGTEVVKSTGTANAALGFSTAADTTAGAAAVAKANIVSINPTGVSRVTVIHE